MVQAQGNFIQRGKVTGYIASEANGKPIFLFKLDTSVADGCNYTLRYAVNSDAPKYKGAVMSIMAAYHTQTLVIVYYSKSCTALNNAYDVRWVCVGDIPC